MAPIAPIQMTSAQMDARIFRYGDLAPCETAFIDAHTPAGIKRKTSQSSAAA